MRLRWGAGAAAGADLAGMAAAALVTFVNGLAFGFLCFVMIGVILVAMVAEAGVGEGGAG